LALGISLGKPGVYILNPQGRHPEAADTAKAQGVAGRAVLALAALALVAMLLAAMVPQ